MSIARVSIAALFAAIPNNLSGSHPQLLVFFEGGLTTVCISSDLRIASDISNGALLAGSVDDTYFFLKRFGMYLIT
jgi:hypothetical protein